MQRNRPYNQYPDRDQRQQNREEYNRFYREQFNRYPEYQRRERYRGEYRFDNRDNYQDLDRENFGYDYSYGHAGNSRNGADRGRHQSDYGSSGTYGASRNAGSMGSYGGAQGYGSGRNGYHNYNDRWASGHQEPTFRPEHRIYGAYRDHNSFAEGERESYDGSLRYGSQGADNTRGWRNSRTESRPQAYRNYRRPADDSRYEIYDTSESQYNRGEYGNPSRGSISDDLNLRSHNEFPPQEQYGSRQRARYRQGSGYDQDRFAGTSDLGYEHTATPFESEYYPRNRYYDPLSGNAWNPGSER